MAAKEAAGEVSLGQERVKHHPHPATAEADLTSSGRRPRIEAPNAEPVEGLGGDVPLPRMWVRGYYPWEFF